MKGLLIKDLLTLKSQSKVFAILILFYMVVFSSGDNQAMVPGMLSMLFMMLPITALGYDEKAKWDKYGLTMPISRKDIVLSKYILGLLFLLLATTINILFLIVTSSYSMKELFSIVGLLSATAVFYLSLVLPILFKLGVEKGRIAMMTVGFVPFILFFLLGKLNIDFTAPSEAFLNSLPYLVPTITLLIFIASLLTSIRIYNKREF